MRYVIGVDGGGTKTNAAVVGDDLGVIGLGSGGPANSRSVGMEGASANIAQAITEALRAAEAPLRQVQAICMCMAGFDTDLDLPVPQRAMVLLHYTGVAIFENDVVGAWAGVTAGHPGLVVIAGTGATALGMNTRGDLWRTDGWDYILGDAGSGYQIGLAGIQAAMRMLDGRHEPTLLMRKLGEVFNVDNASAMRRLADSGPLGKLQIAGFARHVSEAAGEGDPVARDILTRAGHDLAENVAAIVERLNMREDEFPVGVVGSVFKSVPWVTAPFREQVRLAAPHAIFRAPLHTPEVGAAILGQRRLDDDDTGSWTLGTGHRTIRRSLTISATPISRFAAPASDGSDATPTSGI